MLFQSVGWFGYSLALLSVFSYYEALSLNRLHAENIYTCASMNTVFACPSGRVPINNDSHTAVTVAGCAKFLSLEYVRVYL